jgi:hypothetical protein
MGPLFTVIYFSAIISVMPSLQQKHEAILAIKGQCGPDRMVVGFTTICAVSAYRH